ncbi:retinoblastoma-associated protein-like isoform X2 [Haliotis rufescens]|uniref:retinoblastoma-associated protein-like isoform X2 n=1 Tax=Haliotis rufescens TaxID=6454 RepID=UPI00201F5D6A|nr:retinoblastoma-associated protein-like isoform X2 [Haliotis rufescens]
MNCQNTNMTKENIKVPSAQKMDTDFLKLCEELELSEEVKKKALVQLKSLMTGSSSEDGQSSYFDLFTCALYMAMVDTRMPYGPLDPQLQCGYLDGNPCITLTSLLQHTNLNITEFFKRMRVLKESCAVSESVRLHLLSLEKNYLIVSALFHTFEKLCRSVFREDPKTDEDSNEENVYFRENVMPPVPETEGVSFRKKLCWTIFLHTKNHFLVDNQDLNHAVLLLMCCLEFVLRTTPSFLLNPPYDVIRIGCLQTTESRTTNMLLKLAEQVKTSIEEVQVIQQNCTEPFFHELPHIDGDLDLERLMEQYDERHKKEGDINEMLFLRHDSHLIPSDHNKNRASVDQSCVSGSPQMMTPVRAAMNTVQQLKIILCNASDQASDKLLNYFKNCAIDPTTSIADRVIELERVFTSNFASSQTTIAEQRFTMAKRLYYRVMESMLNMEHDRLSTNDFSKLLCSDSFHRSLLAASVEIVLMTYGLSCNPSLSEIGREDSQFSFPWVLDVFHLQAFDFFKVLESYIRAEPKLTREIIKHLQWVETQILETIAWKEGSSLFSAIENSDIMMTQPQSPSASSQNSHNTNTAADMYLSPMHPRSGILPPTPTKGSSSVNSSASPRAAASPGSQDGASTSRPAPRRSQSLNLFFSKVGRTGFHKLQKLCTMLEVTKEIQQKIWTCFEYCITNKPALMRNRHIDQIMMCSLYGICKVVEKEIKFKTIVHMYRNLAHVDQAVYKSAFIHGSEFDSIIGFYNKVFMQNMKTYILQFSVNRPMAPTLSPVPKQMTSPLTASPVFSIPGRKRFYVSPLKESPFKLPPSPSQLTPRSSLLYSFGEGLGSSEKLRNITESLSAYKRHSTPRSLKRLRFDQVSADDEQCVPETCPKVVKRIAVDVSPLKSPAHSSKESNKMN